MCFPWRSSCVLCLLSPSTYCQLSPLNCNLVRTESLPCSVLYSQYWQLWLVYWHQVLGNWMAKSSSLPLVPPSTLKDLPSLTVAHSLSDFWLEQKGVLYVHHPTPYPRNHCLGLWLYFRKGDFWYMENQQFDRNVIFTRSLMLLVFNSLGLWYQFLFSIAWHGF